MEAEYKYRISDASIFDSILKYSLVSKHLRNEKKDSIRMYAVYYDTADEDLRNAGIAYRIRNENDRLVATIKWDIDVSEGLHRREEINLVINDERFLDAPNIEIFKSSDAYEVLHQAVGDKPLEKTVEMDFERQLVRIDTGKSINAISLDSGVIKTPRGDMDILELEIELYHGEEEDFKQLSRKIAEKYGLEPEDESKLQRAFK